MNKKGERFLTEVTNHIKSKEAKDLVATELNFHLKQAKNMWMDKGLSEEVAEDKAVEQMGSPSKLGRELNKLHKPKVDWFLIGLLVAAMGLGFLPVLVFEYTNDVMINKVIFVILGVLTAIGMMLLDYRKLERMGWLFYVIGVVVLLILYCFPNASMIGEPLIQIGPIAIDCLMAVPFFFLAWASFFNNSRLKIIHLVVLYLFSLYLFLIVSTLSSIFIYITMVFVMLWWSKLGKKTSLIITVVPICLFIIKVSVSWSSGYHLDRLLGYLNPESDAGGAGFMYIRLKEVMSSAGWFGTYGDMKFIPAPDTDFVFASLTYYYGYWLALILVFVLSLFVARLIVISYKINDRYGKLLLVGGLTLFVFQFIYNVGMILGLLPLAAISLPFISYGLTPTVFHALIMGIVLSVYRRKDIPARKSA
ncbi:MULTISPECIES: FtsW/RodA/SpoVE family cell cycle protein [Bacillus cereus group]|uniref:FtsW/RodA/SpoVE family cell cycle protein n=1 Tax=Bacillus cereus group TaxID=86661 RepID=UPI0022E484F1|nr:MULTISPECIES: FtsW/RodA/SpoVE family cell cycle protein [Bacillus cereus group]MDA2662297.1 FtsW/RodA/SpoVE family cell cycle protein [Bacillus cereus group sp. Bc032]MDA2673020.1 FtsW/RodA/SpoVE family cell cycle protein [Bacillus cereus group sp. Bc031]MDA2678331.1 FtsW/RodA/SpoVE family cell cycle protein [Bacillus cereus group sp. Bc029]MDA2683840.1 FtsW/RodA/SpoVE family cell cycle protein [Bacillus cereus group sp. Bc030]MDA2739433.1 FtsW/RodA/SpoVE family cell cycle protein [Bacillus